MKVMCNVSPSIRQESKWDRRWARAGADGGAAPAATESNRRGIKTFVWCLYECFFDGMVMVDTTMKNPERTCETKKVGAMDKTHEKRDK